MAGSNLKMLVKTGTNSASDECYTPPEAVKPLLPYLDKTKVYKEITAGISLSIVNELRLSGYICSANKGDFFAMSDTSYDAIISNPPYSKKDKFLAECYKIGKPFALLLPVTALGGIRRGDLYRNYGLELLILPKRIDFTGKGSPHFNVAWFCHKLLPQPIIIG